MHIKMEDTIYFIFSINAHKKIEKFNLIWLLKYSSYTLSEIIIIDLFIKKDDVRPTLSPHFWSFL